MKLIDRLFRREEINGNGICPTYLYRWTLLQVGTLFSLYLHKFVGDDWSTDLHDHPKRFWSIGLWGGYTEVTAPPVDDGLTSNYQRGVGCIYRQWRAPWFRTFPAEHIHRLVGPTPAKPCWTLVIVGRPVRPWGFWSLGRWVPWKTYVNSADAKKAKSCP